MRKPAEPVDDKTRSLEELASDGTPSGLEAEIESKEGQIGAPFDPAKIDVITQLRTVDLLTTRLKEGELNLSPDFQRRSNLWNATTKSGLVESMLLRIPIPSLYVAEDSQGNYTVVDGLQRMCGIAHFVEVAALNKAVNSKLDPLRLTGLESLRDYNGKTFAELPRPLRRRIEETELTLHVIRASTPPEVKFNIFSRINRGGLPLKAQEIRNAIYPGDWRTHVKRMAESESFLRATEEKIRGERMEDLELVLRFAALYSAERDRPPDENLDDFLNDFVQKRCQGWNPERWTGLVQAFDRAMCYAPKVFGQIAFRKYSAPGVTRRPINRGLFETQSVVLARRSAAQLDELAARSDKILTAFKDKFEGDGGFSNALLYATGRGSSSNKRVEVFEQIFKETLNA